MACGKCNGKRTGNYIGIKKIVYLCSNWDAVLTVDTVVPVISLPQLTFVHRIGDPPELVFYDLHAMKRS